VLGGVGAKRVLDLAIDARSLENVADLARAMVPVQDRAGTQHSAPNGVLAK
jgi:hypothetical protein